jgi:predicted dehydrogenase
VPWNPSGNQLAIYGRDGTLVISDSSLNGGPNRLHGSRGREAPAPLDPPERFTLVPDGVPPGPPRNVAQAYVRLATAFATGERFEPDFAHAVTRHTLIDAIERSSAEGRSVRVHEVGSVGA